MLAWRRLASGWFDRVVVPLHNATLSRSFAYWTTLGVVLAVLMVGEVLLAYRAAEGAAARNARHTGAQLKFVSFCSCICFNPPIQ